MSKKEQQLKVKKTVLADGTEIVTFEDSIDKTDVNIQTEK